MSFKPSTADCLAHSSGFLELPKQGMFHDGFLALLERVSPPPRAFPLVGDADAILNPGLQHCGGNL
jgi:hypothetical protein